VIVPEIVPVGGGIDGVASAWSHLLATAGKVAVLS